MKIHNLGFPRIGERRELKKALESYWRGQSSKQDLYSVARQLRAKNWKRQAFLDLVPVGEFSFYDQVLDMSFMLGNIPERAIDTEGALLDRYFRVARGRSANDPEAGGIRAGEMTKWFDTNYHYIVPEFSARSSFVLNPQPIIDQLEEARALGINTKPVIIGPMTYLWLGKAIDGIDKFTLLNKVVPIYKQLLELLATKGNEWVQVDEPMLVTDLEEQHFDMFAAAYAELAKVDIKLMLTTYFGLLENNRELAFSLPAQALHIDGVRGEMEIEEIVSGLPQEKELSLGLVDGRNIWKTNLSETLDILEPIAESLGDRLWLAPSCSLLHVPVDLDQESKMDKEFKSWMAFAVQKLEELKILKLAVNEGRDAVAAQLAENRQALESRRTSTRVHNPTVQSRISKVDSSLGDRKLPYVKRAVIQMKNLNLPLYPTTTIGSFPQTEEIRKVRKQFRNAEICESEYVERLKAEIKQNVAIQEELGLDVLVHGEPERNDMVEYFAEQLDGYTFTQGGWVQSYGSRCVKPPIIFGDVSRPKPITTSWISYAQSLTKKPMKAIVTGPVTMLNWAFVRDDQARASTCLQIALAVRDEVQDLEKHGLRIIQIDEAALREGLPLRKSKWKEYLRWAVNAYKIAANGVDDETQIHTHMCYSEFNDIIEDIVAMDADVITIETSRSNMELLDVFDRLAYPNEIGPGVYDIHSPNVPTVDSIVLLLQKAVQRIPRERLWVNPDCGLKTRAWPETKAALRNMVEAAWQLREL